MKITLVGRRSQVAFLGTTALVLTLSPAKALDDANTRDLRRQLEDLTTLVRTMSQQDRAQINTLAAEVKSLKAQLVQQQSASVGQATALPRVAQGTYGGPFGKPAQTPHVPPPASRAQPRVVQNSSNKFSFESADGEYAIGLTGRVQLDAGDYVNFHPDSRLGPQDLTSGFNARRARIGVVGRAFGSWGFAFVYDGGNSQDSTPKGIETAQLVFSGVPGLAVELGYSDTLFTLDEATSSNDLLFLERASPSNIATNFNTGDARANFGGRFFGDRYWVGAYLTGPAVGDSHTLTGERFGAFQRAAYQVLQAPDYSLHLGLGVDELLKPSTNSVTSSSGATTTPYSISLSDQPELRIDPTSLLSTGVVGTAANPLTGGYVFDVENAGTWNSLYWQGEYYHYQLERRGLQTADFDGAYGELAWTITGETRKYNPQAGAYFRVTPDHPFHMSREGWGAWEVAARLSYMDLNDMFVSGRSLSSQPEAVLGGRQIGYTFGLNWYPNDFVRFLLDYDHVVFDKPNGMSPGPSSPLTLGRSIGARLDAVALRAQVAF